MKKNCFIFIRGSQPQKYYHDWNTISSIVNSNAANINCHIISNGQLPIKLEKSAVDTPSFTICLYSPPPRLPRGLIFYNRAIQKLDEYKLYQKAGVRFPNASIFQWGMLLNKSFFGDYVVLKPLDLRLTSKASTLVVKTDDVPKIRPNDFPDMPWLRHSRLMVQQFIYSGSRQPFFRSHVFLGEILYQYRRDFIEPINDVSELVHSSAVRAGLTSIRELDSDVEIMNYAKHAYKAMPEVPSQGIDLMRCAKTGLIYALESNSGGNTWHFSSRIGLNIMAQIGREKMLAQFGAHEKAAKAIINATNHLAQ